MSQQLTLLLARHGETHFNAEGRFQGAMDIPLSDRGRQQATALQKRLATVWQEDSASLPGPPTHVFASQLCRAVETAEILRLASPNVSHVVSLPLLQERSYGSWEGLTTDEIRERFGAHSQPADAEPFDEVRERIQKAFVILWHETLKDSSRGTALVVGHGASLRYFFALALGISNEAVRRIQLDNTGLSVAVFLGHCPETCEGRVLLLNETSHLTGLGFAERPRATPPR